MKFALSLNYWMTTETNSRPVEHWQGTYLFASPSEQLELTHIEVITVSVVTGGCPEAKCKTHALSTSLEYFSHLYPT